MAWNILKIFKLIVQLAFNMFFLDPQAIGGFVPGIYRNFTKNGGEHRGDVVAQHADPTGMVSRVGAREAQIPCKTRCFQSLIQKPNNVPLLLSGRDSF